MAKVVDLDSRRPPRPLDAGELVREAIAAVNEVEAAVKETFEAVRAIDRRRASYEADYRWERTQRLSLERSLREERSRAFLFTPDEVLAALGRVYAGHPVSATEVAKALGIEKPTQSQRVRVGQALRGLRGAVTRHEGDWHRHTACRWEPAGGRACDGR